MEYFLKIKKYTLFSLLLFLLGSFTGYFSSLRNPLLFEEIIREASFLVEFLSSLKDWQLFLVIFLNNAIKVFISILLGIFFAIFPMIFLLINGYFLGIVGHYYGWVVLGGILPHGIFELPAVFLGAGAGIYIGTLAIERTLRKKEIDIKSEVVQAFKFFLSIIFPLLFLAALIEVYITPFILSTLLS